MSRSFAGPVMVSVLFGQLGCLASPPEPRKPEPRQSSEEAAEAPAEMAPVEQVPLPDVPEKQSEPMTLIRFLPYYVDILPKGLVGDVGRERLDLACQMQFKTSAGEEVWFTGAFALCPGNAHDMTPLIGKKVVLTTVFGRRQDHMCERNPECFGGGEGIINVEEDLVRNMVAAP